MDAVEWLVIDDGSSDRTVEAARAAGADHVVRLPAHRGLARAFTAGLEASLKAGADIVVNTDADNQYDASFIPAMIEPILKGEAEIVVGVRPIAEIEHFSPVKKWLHAIGTRVVQFASRTRIEDAPSGFRAMSREAAAKLHVFSDYTYTLETVIQAGLKGMAIRSVPVKTNAPLRPSRLMANAPEYVYRSFVTILRIFVTYRPLQFFSVLGVLFLVPGLLLGLRFLGFYFSGHGQGHVQSVILSGALSASGLLLFVIALVADLIAVNRRLLEDVDVRLKKVEDAQGNRDA